MIENFKPNALDLLKSPWCVLSNNKKELAGNLGELLKREHNICKVTYYHVLQNVYYHNESGYEYCRIINEEELKNYYN